MSERRFSAENYRGAKLSLWLGALVAASGVAGSVVVAAFGHVDPAGWRVLLGSLLVFAAGVVDDLVPAGPRGLHGHLRELAKLHMTTGILKAFVIAAASLVVVVSLPHRKAGVEIAGIVAIAACANLWNGLDVRPGRALKAFLSVGAAVLVSGVSLGLVPVLPGVLVGAVLAMPLDLGERAMLGDGGANLLGFAAGLGLYVALPRLGVVALAAVAVGLNVLAETVTLSRLIERVPPLRWIDGLGRRRCA